jgi:phage baseplate assembly protein gpV
MSGLRNTTALRVQIDGVALPVMARRTLHSASVLQRRSRPTTATLTFESVDGALPLTLQPAARPRLTLCVDDEVAPFFAGEVVAVETEYGAHGLARVVVAACDRLHRLRLRQPVRAHVELDCAELARTLVADLGLTVEASDPGPVTLRRVQARQTDLELLEEACEAAGLGFFAVGDRVQLFGSGGDSSDPIERRIGRDVDACTLTHDETSPPCVNVEAFGFEPDGRSPVRGAFYSDGLADETSPSFDGVWRLCGESFTSSEQATARATAVHERHTARRASLRATVVGDTALRPGARLSIVGTGAEAKAFVLSEVLHRFDATTGHVCEVDSRPPVANTRSAPPTPTWTYGDVVDIEDPLGAGRIRVRMTAFGDLESDWLAVTVPAAGPEKGLCALPDVGDRVAVLLQGGDLAHSIVLGGVFGSAPLPEPDAPQSRARSFTLRTARGQLVQLDDVGDRICVEDRGGSRLELGPDRVVLHSAVDLELRAPGRNLTLSAARIDFERS